VFSTSPALKASFIAGLFFDHKTDFVVLTSETPAPAETTCGSRWGQKVYKYMRIYLSSDLVSEFLTRIYTVLLGLADLTNLFHRASSVKSFVIVHRMPSAFNIEAEQKTQIFYGFLLLKTGEFMVL
jgi:hypothetical protein